MLQATYSADRLWFMHGSGLPLTWHGAGWTPGAAKCGSRSESVLCRHFSCTTRVGPSPARTLLAAVWGDTLDPASNVVEACVRRLRSKIGVDAIATVRNLGYSMRAS